MSRPRASCSEIPLTFTTPKVDGAIHSAAGPGLYDECKLLNGAETGEVKLTTGHNLPAKHIAHAVGPIYSSSRKEHCEEKLRSCYRTTLELAVQNELKSVVSCDLVERIQDGADPSLCEQAFSGISTGM